jgi:hypothetical protein
MTPKIWLPAAVLALAASCLAPSCNDDKQDQTSNVDRSGSIETSVSVHHADSTHDVILTTHKVWTNFKEFATYIHRDTVPALGLMTTAGENANGDTTTVHLQKDYQIFITMK